MWPFSPKVELTKSPLVKHYASSLNLKKFINKKYQSSGIFFKKQYTSKYSISTLSSENHIFSSFYPWEYLASYSKSIDLLKYIISYNHGMQTNPSPVNQHQSVFVCEYCEEFSKPEEIHAWRISPVKSFDTIMTPLRISTICKDAWDSLNQREEKDIINWMSLQNHVSL